MRFFIYFRTLALFLPFLVSCSFSGAFYEERVTLILPEIPLQTAAELGISSWLVQCESENGTRRFSVPVEQRRINVTIKKNAFAPVLAYPVAEGIQKDFGRVNSFFKPAGAIYPANCVGSAKKELTLLWQAGFSADFARALLTRSELSYEQAVRALSRVNWVRFQAETFKTQNPWLLDREKLFTAVLSERITVYSFTAKPQRQKTAIVGVPADFLHGDYFPSGFIYPDEGEPGEFTCLLADGINDFMSREYLIRVGVQNSTERLAISAIRRYTD